ncbi:integrase core domain-containing protein [Pseudovibrio sp. Alg231-02]
MGPKWIVENFNGSFREEYLNEPLFLSLSEARGKIKAWKHDDNT